MASVTVQQSHDRLVDVVDSIDDEVHALASKAAGMYSKAEVDAAITTAVAGVTQFRASVVQSLPASGEAGVVYFTPSSSPSASDSSDEWLWVAGRFERVGSASADLTAYVTRTALDADLALKADKADVALKADLAALAPVALSGVYSDLAGVPADAMVEVELSHPADFNSLKPFKVTFYHYSVPSAGFGGCTGFPSSLSANEVHVCCFPAPSDGVSGYIQLAMGVQNNGGLTRMAVRGWNGSSWSDWHDVVVDGCSTALVNKASSVVEALPSTAATSMDYYRFHMYAIPKADLHKLAISDLPSSADGATVVVIPTGDTNKSREIVHVRCNANDNERVYFRDRKDTATYGSWRRVLTSVDLASLLSSKYTAVASGTDLDTLAPSAVTFYYLAAPVSGYVNYPPVSVSGYCVLACFPTAVSGEVLQVALSAAADLANSAYVAYRHVGANSSNWVRVATESFVNTKMAGFLSSTPASITSLSAVSMTMVGVYKVPKGSASILCLPSRVTVPPSNDAVLTIFPIESARCFAFLRIDNTVMFCQLVKSGGILSPSGFWREVATSISISNYLGVTPESIDDGADLDDLATDRLWTFLLGSPMTSYVHAPSLSGTSVSGYMVAGIINSAYFQLLLVTMSDGSFQEWRRVEAEDGSDYSDYRWSPWRRVLYAGDPVPEPNSKDLQSGANLDDCKEVGVTYCWGNSTASSILNKPSDFGNYGGFCRVQRAYDVHVMQTVMPYGLGETGVTNAVYYRTYYKAGNVGGGWSSWYKVVPTAVPAS